MSKEQHPVLFHIERRVMRVSTKSAYILEVTEEELQYFITGLAMYKMDGECAKDGHFSEVDRLHRDLMDVRGA